MEVGDITVLYNIVFDKKTKSGERVDHAMKQGRPCIFIGEIDEKMYFLPIMKHIEGQYNTIIEPTKENKLSKKSMVNILNIIEKPIAFYSTHSYIDEKIMLDIFNRLLKYYKEDRNDKQAKVKCLAAEYLQKLERGSNGSSRV